jgi:hypothetical protein
MVRHDERGVRPAYISAVLLKAPRPEFVDFLPVPQHIEALLQLRLLVWGSQPPPPTFVDLSATPTVLAHDCVYEQTFHLSHVMHGFVSVFYSLYASPGEFKYLKSFTG